ncbi:MAG: hypothetical protein ABFD50_17925 [Smithella sp.]
MKMSDLKFKPLKPGENPIRVMNPIAIPSLNLKPFLTDDPEWKRKPSVTVLRFNLNRPFMSGSGGLIDIQVEKENG